jgi:L-threonylcarbamoyladenylate synthase
LPPGVTTFTPDGINTVAVRVPANPAARAIIAAAGGALAVTSANLSGAAPAVEAREVVRYGLPRSLLVVDGGRAPGGMPSTIVVATSESPEILREGAIPASAITAALADIELKSQAGTPPGYDQRTLRQKTENDSLETAS